MSRRESNVVARRTSLLVIGVLLVGISGALSACSDRALTEALEEPLRVHDAQFVEGELPGKRPRTAEEIQGGVEPAKPTSTSASTDLGYLRQLAGGVRFRGWATDDAVAVAVRFEDAGSGYWLFPTGPADPGANGDLVWDFVADFGESLEPGLHNLLVAAIDEDGKSGTQNETTICINSLVPDNGNACYPEVAPPDLVIGIEWDSDVDLDLIVEAPDGSVIDSNNPTSAKPDESGNIDTRAPGIGNLDLDSNKDCQIDGRNREHVVFANRPLAGTYRVYANLSRSCGQDSVRYLVSLHSRVNTDDGFDVESKERAAGELVAVQANGGKAIGTFVTEFKLR